MKTKINIIIEGNLIGIISTSNEITSLPDANVEKIKNEIDYDTWIVGDVVVDKFITTGSVLVLGNVKFKY